jgi:hypothetical protein
MKQDRYKMYFLVVNSLANLNKGIQCGHAALEYSVKYSESEDFKRFVFYDKTWVILNGGTSNHIYHDKTIENKIANGTQIKVAFDETNESSIGSMEKSWNFLQENKIESVYFIEPDTNNMMTAICFLVPNRVFNRQEFPDFDKWIVNPLLNETLSPIEKIQLKEIYLGINKHEDITSVYEKYFSVWSNMLGGEKFGQLRIFLNQFRLA